MDGWSSVVMVFLLDFCRIGDQTGCVSGGGGGLGTVQDSCLHARSGAQR